MADEPDQDPWYWSHEILRDVLNDRAERYRDTRSKLKYHLRHAGLLNIDELREMVCESNTDGRSVLLLTEPGLLRLRPQRELFCYIALAEILRPLSSQYESAVQQLLRDSTAVSQLNTHTGETLVEVENGKKRRRLAPTAVDPSTIGLSDVSNLVFAEAAQTPPSDIDSDDDDDNDELEFCYLNQVDTRDPREQMTAYKTLLRDLALIQEAMEIVSLPALGEPESESDESQNEMDEAEEDNEDQIDFSSLLKEMEEQYKQQWRSKKLPTLERRAHKIYFEGGKHRLRSELVIEAKRWREHLDQRLSQIKEALLSGDISQVEEFKRLCTGMETTVCDILEKDWRIALWQGEEPPAPTSRHSATSVAKEMLTIQDHTANQDGREKKAIGEDGFIVQDEAKLGYGRRCKNSLLTSLGKDPGHNRLDSGFFDGRSNSPICTPVKERSLSDFIDTLDDPVSLDLKNRSDIMNIKAISRRFELEGSPGSAYNIRSDDAPDEMDISDPEPEDMEWDPQVAEAEIESQQSEHSQSPVPAGKPRDPVLIELSSSPPESSVRTSPIPVVRTTTQASGTSESKLNPLKAPVNEIYGWSWEKLENDNDGIRTVLKVVFTILRKPERTSIGKLLTNDREHLDDHVRKVYMILGNPKSCPETHLTTVDLETSDAFFLLARLYACWFDTTHVYMEGEPVPDDTLRAISSATLYEQNEDFDRFKGSTRAALSHFKCLEEDSPTSGPSPSDIVISTSSSEDFERVGSEEDYDESEDDLRASQGKRKRPIPQSLQAKTLQVSAQKRAEQASRTTLKIRMPKPHFSESDQGFSEYVVNSGRLHGLAKIFIDSHVGLHLKAHQLEGIQFMWREIVTVNDSDESMEGCLLAHVMGLGKTMQAITLLVTIAEAASSSDLQISNQIPRSLKKSRTLVLCPAGLLQNWTKEFETWTTPRSREVLGPVRAVDSAMPSFRRLNDVRHWYTTGGVLLMGYEMFRGLVDDAQVQNEFKDYLLSGPTIIIADEAHMLRNNSSDINKMVQRFRSKSRIAITGSPLNNDLDEIYEMINWVAPGYLGPREEFKGRFKIPIQSGGYVDSTHAERIRSQKKLKLLMRIIGPKVDRKDITVLKDDLEPKNEFVLKVPLTELQMKSYRMLMDSLLRKKTSQTNTNRVLEWLSVLSLLCNHPQSFETKLLEKKEKSKDSKKGKNKVVRNAPGGEQLETDLSQHVSALGIDEADVRQQQELFNEMIPFQNRALPELSHKTELLVNILDFSKQAGEQVLVFSQHLPTLAYLKELFTKRNDKFTIIEGKVSANDRFIRCEQFNEGKFNIILISSRSGSLGHNLTGGSRVIIFDFSFNPMWEEQAVARAYRIGQKRPVFVYRFVTAGTFEDALYNRTVYKTQLASRVVDHKNVLGAAERAGELLFEPREAAQKDVDAYRGKDPLVLDKLLAKPDSPIRDIVAMETLAIEEEDFLTADDLREVEQEYQAENMATRERERKKVKITDERSRKKLESAAQKNEAEQQKLARPEPSIIKSGSNSASSTLSLHGHIRGEK